MPKLSYVIYLCNNETLINSLAATPFKFQWQKVKVDRLEPQDLPVEECLPRKEM